MITTTFAAGVLSAVLSAGAVATPTWQTDYSAAMATAADQKKPLAVFIARGESGYTKLVGGGEIPAEAGQVLAKNYVCVYVDTDTAAGKSLAGQFDLSKGLVISNCGGNVQALRHTGAVAPVELTSYVVRYSDPARPVVTTEKVGVVVSTGVVPAGAVFGGCPNGRCGAVSTYPSAPVYAPAYSAYPAYPAFSSCPNGRCPNAR
ncbi:MAG: hypothetical protein JWO38_4631 [Gemmataceae bacterium]|nr:hypothetical protein [Gemmataceae bacterium]